jgi:diacylglycerol O-acyltransferase / wax synthase
MAKVVHSKDEENNRLSGGDALFLHLEREGMPLNVASVSIFEGVIALKPCTRFIESKLPLIPRYRQRLVIPPFNIGNPTWEYDPDFDIRNHVHEVILKRGTETELKKVAGQVLSKVLDRRRPLWDFTLVRGLKGNRTAIITRMHHCLADGLAGVALLNVLMDTSPKMPSLRRTKMPSSPTPRHDTATQVLDGLITTSFSVAQRVLSAQMEFIDLVQKLLAAENHVEFDSHSQANGHPGARVPTLDEFTRFMPEVTSITQRLPFNVMCRGSQRFTWTEIPLEEIKAVKNVLGATVNDVILAIMTSTVRRYVEMRGARVRGRLLRFGVPVNVRNGKADPNVSSLGNRITFIPVTVPLDVRNPRKLLSAIRERIMFLKSAHVAELVGLAGSVLGAIPMGAQVIAGSIANELPLGLCNMVCTNVPGPESPLYLMTHKLVRCYPYVPIGGDLGLNCAVLTYDGIAHFGFSGNVQAAPRMESLERFLQASFADLKEAAGLGRRASNKPRPSLRKKPPVSDKQVQPTKTVVSTETGPISENRQESSNIPLPTAV